MYLYGSVDKYGNTIARSVNTSSQNLDPSFSVGAAIRTVSALVS